MGQATTIEYLGRTLAGTEMRFEPVKEDWSEYRLEDGSVKDHRFEAQRHEQRWRALRDSPELAKIRNFMTGYQYLQSVSEQVRYDPGFRVGEQHLHEAQSNLNVIQQVISSKLSRKLHASTPATSR